MANLAANGRRDETKKARFKTSQDFAVGLSEGFHTVSLGTWVNKGKKEGKGL
jgi:hypothetical protein